MMIIFGNGFAPVQIFHAIPSLLFSAAAELAALKHPRRPTQSGTLEERFGKAKSSKAASAIPAYFFVSIYVLPTQYGREQFKEKDKRLIIQS